MKFPTSSWIWEKKLVDLNKISQKIQKFDNIQKKLRNLETHVKQKVDKFEKVRKLDFYRFEKN